MKIPKVLMERAEMLANNLGISKGWCIRHYILPVYQQSPDAFSDEERVYLDSIGAKDVVE
jgi:hypothetical protein|tara:strand:- start:63 stop:242 length:180 start_codon:yes stop_codon:yes gene_type:complete